MGKRATDDDDARQKRCVAVHLHASSSRSKKWLVWRH